MYSRVSPLGLAWSLLCGLTLLFLWITLMIFGNWRVETAGVWSTGTITSIDPCYSTHGARLSTVHLSVQFIDRQGASHLSRTDCEYDRYHEGQSIAVRYLPENPGHILIQPDIGAGQGGDLMVLLVLDAICLPLTLVATIYGLKRMRRHDDERDAARQRSIDSILAQHTGKRKPKPPAPPPPRPQVPPLGDDGIVQSGGNGRRCYEARAEYFTM